MNDRLLGCLWGTMLGDSLGLPAEGLSAEGVRRRLGPLVRHRLIGRTGFVSDDTEQAALVAQALARSGSSAEACADDFRRALVGWFLRLPFGVGLATVRACARAAAGLRPTGVLSAGNGAMMRAPVVGAFFPADPPRRLAYGRALAEVTHRDERAVGAALLAGEVTAACVRALPDADRAALVRAAAERAPGPAADRALRGAGLAASSEPAAAAAELGTSGYCLHTAGWAAYCFVRAGRDALAAVRLAAEAGGDADTNAAVVGAWSGALIGASGLPRPLVDAVHDGPFGPGHLAGLAAALASGSPPPSYSWTAAMARNLALYPVVLAHGFRRLLPPVGEPTTT